MTSSPTRISAFLLAMLLVSVAFVVAFAILFSPVMDTRGGTGWIAGVLVFDRFYVDFLLVSLLGIWLINLPGILRLVGYAWYLLFVAGYLLQFLAVYVGGEFVTALAVDNINHIDLLLDVRALAPLAALAAALFGLAWLVERRMCSQASWKSVSAVSAGLLLGGLLVQHGEKWIPGQVMAQRDAFYQHKDNYVSHKSPLKSLYLVLYGERGSRVPPLTAADIEHARQYGIDLALDRMFPLTREHFYRNRMPFAAAGKEGKPPNVIVFFSEGLAARTINGYDDQFAGLTPNIEVFSRESMRVDNYYNHTFATYRGLHGQLCSLFPFYGGIGGWHTDYANLKNVHYYCLPHVLNEAGYRTLFLDTHRADSAFVDEMVFRLGFSNVINAEEVSERHLDGAEPMRDDALSDNQLMTGLVGVLRSLEHGSEQPFFLGLYNLQTHAWQKLTGDGKPYGKGGNHVLNTIHNYDYAFGEFWEYFRDSSLYDNTVVVFTSDHTHFPERSFLEVVGDNDDYRPVFVDRIPLLIHDPRRQLPAVYDAGNASSIDFAPSLIHWLGLPNRENPFLGTSIFDRARTADGNRGRSIAAGGDEIFLVDSAGVHKKGHVPAQDQARRQELEFIEKLLSTLWQLEQHNRIWPAPGEDPGRH